MVLLLAAVEGDDLSACGVAANIFKNESRVVKNSICSYKGLGGQLTSPHQGLIFHSGCRSATLLETLRKIILNICTEVFIGVHRRLIEIFSLIFLKISWIAVAPQLLPPPRPSPHRSQTCYAALPKTSDWLSCGHDRQHSDFINGR